MLGRGRTNAKHSITAARAALGDAGWRQCASAGGRLARLAGRRLTDWALRTSFWIRHDVTIMHGRRRQQWPSTQQQVENHPLSSRRSRLAISSGSAACSSALPTAIGSAAVVVAMIGGAGQQLQV